MIELSMIDSNNLFNCYSFTLEEKDRSRDNDRIPLLRRNLFGEFENVGQIKAYHDSSLKNNSKFIEMLNRTFSVDSIQSNSNKKSPDDTRKAKKPPKLPIPPKNLKFDQNLILTKCGSNNSENNANSQNNRQHKAKKSISKLDLSTCIR